MLDHGFEQGEGTDDIVAIILVWPLDRFADIGEAGEMQNGVRLIFFHDAVELF
jgi:hypothetical protein